MTKYPITEQLDTLFHPLRYDPFKLVDVGYVKQNRYDSYTTISYLPCP